MELALELKGVGKAYKAFTLADVSFRLPGGYIMGLIGPNGAGKTRLIKLILNLVRRHSGVIKVLQLDNLAHEAEIKASKHRIPLAQPPGLPPRGCPGPAFVDESRPVAGSGNELAGQPSHKAAGRRRYRSDLCFGPWRMSICCSAHPAGPARRGFPTVLLPVVNRRRTSKTAYVPGEKNPLTWTCAYAGLTFNQMGREFPLGGINEAGLVVEELSYSPARYPAMDAAPAVSELQWIQYQLDVHSSVKEVIASQQSLGIRRWMFGLHYFICDASGACAIVEFLDGTFVCYSDDSLIVPVLANDTYRNSTKYLRFHAGFGGTRMVSGGPESPERFVRAATMLKGYSGKGPIVDYAFDILKSVSQHDTQCSNVYDVKARAVHFKTRSVPEIRGLSLLSQNLSCGAPLLALSLPAGGYGLAPPRLQPCTADMQRRLLTRVFARFSEEGFKTAKLCASLLDDLLIYTSTVKCAGKAP